MEKWGSAEAPAERGAPPGVVYQSHSENLLSLDSDAWDDTALIKAWDSQIDNYMKTKGGRRMRTQDGKANEGNKESELSSRNKDPPKDKKATTNTTAQTSSDQKEESSSSYTGFSEYICIKDSFSNSANELNVRKGMRVYIYSIKDQWGYGQLESREVGWVQLSNLLKIESSNSGETNSTYRPNPQSEPLPKQPPQQPNPTHESKGFGYSDLPRVPPFPHTPSTPTTSDEALADLLKAWYYSGYYTGRYKALKEIYGWK